MSKSDNPFLNPEWLELQKQYINTLMNSGYTAHDSTEAFSPAGSDIWNQALEGWWHSVSSGLPVESRSSINHVFKQTQSFYSIINQFAHLLSDMSTMDSDHGDWQIKLSHHFNMIRKVFAQSGIAPGNQQAFNPWGSPFNEWQQMLSTISPAYSDLFKEMETKGYNKFVHSFTSLPGMEMLPHEIKEQFNQGMQLWKVFYDECREYQALYEKIGSHALDKLEKKILENGRNGEKISSLRDLYNLWIDCNEDAYHECMSDNGYLDLYSQLVNTLIDIKSRNDSVMETVLDYCNAPTKRNMDAVYKSQHDFIQELDEAKMNQKKNEDEIEQLKAELKSVLNQLSSMTSEKANRKKKIRKKR